MKFTTFLILILSAFSLFSQAPSVQEQIEKDLPQMVESLSQEAQTSSEPRAWHLYRVLDMETQALEGARIIPNIETFQPVFGVGDTFTGVGKCYDEDSEQKECVQAYTIASYTGFNVSGLFVQMYIPVYSPEKTTFFRQIGLIN